MNALVIVIVLLLVMRSGSSAASRLAVPATGSGPVSFPFGFPNLTLGGVGPASNSTSIPGSSGPFGPVVTSSDGETVTLDPLTGVHDMQIFDQTNPDPSVAPPSTMLVSPPPTGTSGVAGLFPASSSSSAIPQLAPNPGLSPGDTTAAQTQQDASVLALAGWFD